MTLRVDPATLRLILSVACNSVEYLLISLFHFQPVGWNVLNMSGKHVTLLFWHKLLHIDMIYFVWLFYLNFSWRLFSTGQKEKIIGSFFSSYNWKIS